MSSAALLQALACGVRLPLLPVSTLASVLVLLTVNGCELDTAMPAGACPLVLGVRVAVPEVEWERLASLSVDDLRRSRLLRLKKDSNLLPGLAVGPAGAAEVLLGLALSRLGETQKRRLSDDLG